MPIYAYKCESCGFIKDVLQKMSDAQLSECPGCGASTFRKQLTSAGFQLKGSGWYTTDFKGAGTAKPSAAEAPTSAAPATVIKPAEAASAKPTPAAASASGDRAAH